MKIFHILAPRPRRGSANAFYLEGAARAPKTLCGAPVTGHDIRYSWQTDGVGDYICCQQCIAVKMEQKKASRSRASVPVQVWGQDRP